MRKQKLKNKKIVIYIVILFCIICVVFLASFLCIKKKQQTSLEKVALEERLEAEKKLVEKK